MSRAPFQVLVFPYQIMPNNEIHYALFKREPSTGGYWQGIAGGGEKNETPLQAAKRESFEEAGISESNKFIKLDCYAMIPVVEVCGFEWGEDILVIPEYCFGVNIKNEKLRLSSEHTEFMWTDYNSAKQMLFWESNKNALWELDYRLRRGIKKIH